MNKLYVVLLLLHRATSICAQETPPPTATRWEASAAFATRYNEDILMSMKGDIASTTDQSPWQVSVGRRVGQHWVLSAAHERTVVRHGQAVNDQLLESQYSWWLFGSSYLNTYRTDMLTTEQAMGTTTIGGAYLFRPYRIRRTIGLALRGELGLRLHRVNAEQGVLADHINTFTENYEFYTGSSGKREPGNAALDTWNMRSVVNTAHGTGLSFAMGMRADLHCTRYFSLFSTFGINVPLVKPRFDSYVVPDTDMEFAAHSVDLTGLRASIGAAVHF